jgi:hypothetical protein
MEIQQNNLYISPKIGKYKLIILEKKNNQEILQAESKNQTLLLQIMDQFPRSEYSRQLTGSDTYLYET